jgi:pyridoxal phosphate enzyme (YggS family)
MNSAATIHAVNADIARACGDAGRDPATVTLIAISKTVPADDVAPVIAAGQRVFGENRVQEAKAKWPPLFARHQDLELHLVGALQSNKAKEAVALFDAIHSLDRERLAAALAKEIAAQRRQPLLFVEINTGAEPQKAGIKPQEADGFIALCQDRYWPEDRGANVRSARGRGPSPTFRADCANRQAERT